MVDLLSVSTFSPVTGSITLIKILSATLNGRASSFLTAFIIKFLKIGSAVFAPVSYFPNDFGKLIEPKNEEQLLENLLQFSKNEPVDKDKMHAYAIQNFGKNTIASTFSELYHSSLKKYT